MKHIISFHLFIYALFFFYISDIALQPQPTSNATSPCSANQQNPSSTTTTTGNWTQVYSYEAYQNYMVASLPATELATADVSVTYQP